MAIRSALSSYIINEEQDGFVTVHFDFINDHHDLTAWEFVDQVDADVDDCSSIGENSDDVSESEYAGSDADTIVGEDVESLPEFIVSPEYFVGGDHDADDCSSISETVDDVSERIDGVDVKSVPETIISPDEKIAGEYAKSIPNSSTLPEYMTERIAGYEEEDLEEDDYDLDDELVPYYVNGKLGRDRMRKLGKRSCAKSIKSKRLTCNYNKAGCLRGKHGLGLKHSLM